MNCNFCGTEIPNDGTECSVCGKNINETSVSQEDVYICPVCGRENPPGERKCNFCCSLF